MRWLISDTLDAVMFCLMVLGFTIVNATFMVAQALIVIGVFR